jgi:hypothetical protein
VADCEEEGRGGSNSCSRPDCRCKFPQQSRSIVNFVGVALGKKTATCSRTKFNSNEHCAENERGYHAERQWEEGGEQGEKGEQE